ncbi:MAG: outer membrane protein assembly factor BamD [Verrucomicrobiota bacterium]|nr:outer membrane protein assembly factor BamD [Verrucomicrobiota bacterium]
MRKCFLFIYLIALPLMALEEEDLTWDTEGPTATEYNSYLQEALSDKDWWAVIDYSDILSYHFPTSPFAQESAYLMGLAYYHLDQYELANQTLTAYLNHSSNHSHFEEAIRMKFEIAESFQKGKRKPLFGSHKMPCWVPAKEDALQIYEEVIAALPHSTLAAKALLGKAKLQTEFEDYKPAVETLHLLIRRFPKDEAAAAAYLEINRIYLEQCKNTSLDLDLLDLAEVNLRKFHLAFPRELRLKEAETVVAETQELFAQNLFETGRFFERTHKLPASLLYYNKVVAKYPTTKAAESARQKLDALQKTSTP